MSETPLDEDDCPPPPVMAGALGVLMVTGVPIFYPSIASASAIAP